MKTKMTIAATAALFSATSSAAALTLSGDQKTQLAQIILTVVSFVVGLFINPKKSNN